MTKTEHNAIIYIAPYSLTRTRSGMETYGLPEGLYLGPHAGDFAGEHIYRLTTGWRARHPERAESPVPVEQFVLPADSEFIPAPEDLPDGYEAHPVTLSAEKLEELTDMVYSAPGYGQPSSPVQYTYSNAVAILDSPLGTLPAPLVDRLVRAAARCGHTTEDRAAAHLAGLVGEVAVARALSVREDVRTRADIDALAVMAMPSARADAVGRAVAQFAALSDLHVYAAVTAERRDRVAAAWRSGIHNVRRIALASGISRSTVYSDLVAAGLDPADR